MFEFGKSPKRITLAVQTNFYADVEHGVASQPEVKGVPITKNNFVQL